MKTPATTAAAPKGPIDPSGTPANIAGAAEDTAAGAEDEDESEGASEGAAEDVRAADEAASASAPGRGPKLSLRTALAIEAANQRVGAPTPKSAQAVIDKGAKARVTKIREAIALASEPAASPAAEPKE